MNHIFCTRTGYKMIEIIEYIPYNLLAFKQRNLKLKNIKCESIIYQLNWLNHAIYYETFISSSQHKGGIWERPAPSECESFLNVWPVIIINYPIMNN